MSKGYCFGSCFQTGKFHAAGVPSFFLLFLKIKSEESSRIFSWVPWTGIKIFFFSPCPTDEESRLQTVPVYRSGWVAVTQCPVTQSSFSLSSMLMNRCATSPSWRHAWDCPTQHSANVTAWPGYTADVFVEAVYCGTQLAVFLFLMLSRLSAKSILIYVHIRFNKHLAFNKILNVCHY